MENPIPSGDASLQAAVYRLYLQLQFISKQWPSGSLAGRLVLSIGFDTPDSELALATTMAGGVFLGLEPDPQRLKIAVRNGSCDFMVNTLDEALRVLKNELRKHKPLSTGLLGNTSENLSAMVKRGVQPELLSGEYAALEIFVERGAELLKPSAGDENSSILDEVIWTAANPQDLRRIDRIALDLLPPEDHVRRRWLEQAPGNFHRQTPLQRVLSLRPEELQQLRDALQASSAASPLQAPATLHWRSTDGAEHSAPL